MRTPYTNWSHWRPTIDCMLHATCYYYYYYYYMQYIAM